MHEREGGAAWAAAETLPAVLERWNDIAVRWRLDALERSELVAGPHRDPEDAGTAYRLICGEQRIRLVVGVEPVLRRVLGADAAVRDWLRRAGPELGGRTPLGAMADSPEWMLWLRTHGEGAAS